MYQHDPDDTITEQCFDNARQTISQYKLKWDYKSL